MIAKVWLVEEFFYYNYPFSLPNFFKGKLPKHELEVRAKLFQIYSSVNIEKVISIKEFFNSYSSTLNNKQKTTIKKSFLTLVQSLEDSGFIQSNYKIILNDSYHDIDKLTVKNIDQGFVFYEKLVI